MPRRSRRWHRMPNKRTRAPRHLCRRRPRPLVGHAVPPSASSGCAGRSDPWVYTPSPHAIGRLLVGTEGDQLRLLGRNETPRRGSLTRGNDFSPQEAASSICYLFI
eukprot:1180094-Prorocentrum_minimum.AAC.2